MALSLKDAIRVAEIFEADDIISIPALASRTLLKRVRELENFLMEEVNPQQVKRTDSEQ